MYGRMPGRMLPDGEDDGDTHSLAELMPGSFQKIASLAAASVDTVELAQIQSILSNRGAMDMLEGPKQNVSTRMGEDQSVAPVVDYPLLSAWYNNQNKENIPSDPNILPRRGFTRREGSGRITTRRSFKLDLSDIGHPLLNSSQSSQIPKDVNAFWEAEDAREASETITQKLKGKDKAREVSNQILQCTNQKRHSLVRRKGTGRRPSRKFDIKLSPYVERSTVQPRKEESEKMPLNSLERIEDREAMENGQTFLVESDGLNKDREVREDADGALETFCEEPLSRETSECLLIVQNLDGCGQPSNALNNSGDAENLGSSLDCELTVPENGQSIVEGSETERPKSTPYHKDILSLSSKSTPATSPTPPANPLEALGLMKERRKLDFMQESILNLPSIGERFGSLDVGSSRIKFQLFPSDRVADLPAEADRLESDAMLENAMQSSRLNGIEDREGNALWEESNNLNGDLASVSPVNEDRLQLDSMPTNSVSLDEHNENEGNILVEKTPKKQPHYEQAAVEGEKRVRKLRKSKASEKSRNSLEGEGTSWDDGVRRSKRIRSRPLEYWRGERFLFGRVHESLLTVIGIKYSSPPVCWPKRGYKGPNFKVDSFVSDDYSDYVKFAAL